MQNKKMALFGILWMMSASLPTFASPPQPVHSASLFSPINWKRKSLIRISKVAGNQEPSSFRYNAPPIELFRLPRYYVSSERERDYLSSFARYRTTHIIRHRTQKDYFP